jgi:hypothetical protein
VVMLPFCTLDIFDELNNRSRIIFDELNVSPFTDLLLLIQTYSQVLCHQLQGLGV